MHIAAHKSAALTGCFSLARHGRLEQVDPELVVQAVMANDSSLEESSLRVMGGRLDLVVHATFDAIEPVWRRLEAHPLVSLHQGFDWCRAWATAHHSRLRIVEVRLDGEPGLILPLELFGGRINVTARLIGSDHSNLNTGIFSEGFLRQADATTMCALAARLRMSLPGIDLVHLPCLAINWGGRDMPLARLDGHENHNRTYQLPLATTLEDTFAPLNGKRRRKNFRTSMRKFEEMGGVDHVIASTPAEQHALLDDFFRMKSARFAEQCLPDVFADAAVRAHFHAAADANRSLTEAPLTMHALRMRTSGEHVAVAALSRKGSHVICQFTTIGQGPERAAGPGETLFYLMIQHAQETGAALFDFGMGSSQLKASWTSQETVLKDVTIPLTVLGRLGAIREETTIRLKGMIKQNPALYGLIQKIRARNPGADDRPCNEGADD